MTLRPLSPALLTHGQPAWRCVALALTLLAANGLALAHEGHGMQGSHWHASDLLGLVFGLAVAALVWRTRGDK
jgi:hypothetical protein